MHLSNSVFYFSRLWLAIWLYVLLIYLSLPYMRSVLRTLKESLGRDSFSNALVLTMICAGMLVLVAGWRRGLKDCGLVALPVAVIGIVSLNLSIPEERVHFLQYGLLGIMAAATARNESLALLAKLAIFAILVGVIDECIQWYLPNRVGDVRDVAFNTMGGYPRDMDWKHIVWITLLAVSATFALRASAVEITFIDAGEGEAILLESAGETALIDSGNLISGGVVSEFLKAKGLERLDLVIITHPHLDHLGGIFQVLSRFTIKQRFDNGQDPIPDSDLYRWHRDAYRNSNYQSLSTGETLELGNANILVLNALRPDRTNLNQNSLVLMVSHGDSRALLMADADASVEADLIAQGAALNADLLKVGHHGYSDATSAGFLEKVTPSAAVICINEDNHRGYPSSEVLDRLQEHSIEVMTTYQEGHISFKSDGRGFYRTVPH